MHWQDEGVLLSLRAHGEGHAVAEILTRAHGRHLGLVRGGSSRRLRPILQPGNGFHAVWNARLEQHLGAFTLDLAAERVGRWLHHAAPLHAFGTLASHLRLLAEREPHPGLFDALLVLLDQLDQPHLAGALLIRFELALLQAFGFGLDLARCGATGAADNLTHVSPRTGRAIGQEAATPYAERLLRLPQFLRAAATAEVSTQDIADGAALTGYFFEHHVYGPRGLHTPQSREAFFKLARTA